MTKELMKCWFRDVYFPNAPADSLLLVDSWGCWKDESAIEECRPEGKAVTVKIIPKKTTGKIQPLDAYPFRIWKTFVRHFSDRVLVDDLPVVLYQRDNILKLQSLIHNQFSADRFHSFIKYAWHMCGYVKEEGKKFDTPDGYCFANDLPDECSGGQCQEGSFIRCAHCEKVLCFTHFYLDYHYCGA
jgi:Tc5 transposase C-terminal domain/DDE superfamily endonuclease